MILITGEKRFLTILLGIFVCIGVSTDMYALNVWDVKSNESVNIPVIVKDGHPYFHLGVFADALDTETECDFVAGTCTIRFKDHFAELAIDFNRIFLDYRLVSLEFAPRYINDKFFVPMALLSLLMDQFYENLFIWDEDNETIRKVYSPPIQGNDVSNADSDSVIIAIDPGHGGRDKGMILSSEKSESQICLLIAERLSKILTNRLGCGVILTRSGDYEMPFVERVVKANSARADLFISIHMAHFWEHTPNHFKIFIPQFNSLQKESDDAEFEWWMAKSSQEVNQSLDFAVELGEAVSDAAGGVEWGIDKENLIIFNGLSMPSMMVELSGNSTFYGDVPLDIDPGTDRAAEALYYGVKAVIQSWK